MRWHSYAGGGGAEYAAAARLSRDNLAPSTASFDAVVFWVNADTQPMNPAKSQLYWASWCQDTAAVLPCGS